MTVTLESLLKALDAIEDAETKHIVWSLVDEAWRRDDLIAIIKVACPADDPSAVFHKLLDENMIGEIPRSAPPLYRSRMAETVRLFTNLRQQFPGKSWRSAPSLVADYRFRHQPRRFPLRDVDPVETLRILGELPSVGPKRLEQVRHIVGTRHLSRFQIEATAKVIEAVAARSDRGVVVGAGTGSGKTLAFYLPALSLLADGPRDGDATRVLAIYPRNELLKDQLASALDEVRSLRAAGGPQLRIGAYFGPTPGSADWIHDRSGWAKVGDGRVCPYLTCRSRSSDGEVCGSDLVWRNEDLRQKRERLTCRRCGATVDELEFSLTRNGMQARPPDLLFTTTEMLNRSISDGWSMHVFGIGPKAKRAPELMLLDEAHTYNGVAGAQVGYLLRRWRHAVGRPVAMVGLSATLTNAETFFSELTGIPEDFITEVTPHPDDLIEQGRSYQIVLRGDPASQTALLSTSIQSIMLLRRMLDSPATAGRQGVFGSKMFAFCDNLDLVNRLYRQLLDAEGLDPFNRPKPNGVVLAGLRLAEQAELAGQQVDDWQSRDLDGQHWWFAEQIGCGTAPLSIGRTSSQDSGVLKEADVIVATASLEVGFDDPKVGAVLQHKAPRDEAQFLQRIGRAGRTQTQRPWTTVVLSDFGRDRLAYLDYEQILDPVVPARSLPLGNQSVRKMQAVFCLMEWVALTLEAGGAERITIRKYFSQPLKDPPVGRIVSLLDSVLTKGKDYESFRLYLGRAMRLNPDEVDNLLWEQPRPLMFEVLPTAFRRLSTRWGTDSPKGIRPESFSKDHPLPEFVPRSLFEDLLLPEVRIEAPDGYNDAANTSMPVVQALNEMVPGRVSLRWAVQNVLGLWNPIDLGGLETIDVADGFAVEHEILGNVSVGNANATVPLIRPLVMRPQKAGMAVSQKSNAFLRWELEVNSLGAPLELTQPRHSRLAPVIPTSRAYLHAGSGPVRIRRFAHEIEVNAEVNRKKLQGRRRFVLGQQKVAVGFEVLVDAISFDVTIPEMTNEMLHKDAGRLRQIRRDRFQGRCATQWSLVEINGFLGGRLSDVALAIVAVADYPAAQLVQRPHEWWHEQAAELIDDLLLLDDRNDEEKPLREAILEAFERPDITRIIAGELAALYEDPNDGWQGWLRSRFLATVGAALQQAAQDLCPDFDFDNEVLVDLRWNGSDAEVLMSDVTIGGGGVIEALVRRLSADPRRFEHLVMSALEPSDLEEADHSLANTLDFLDSDPEIKRQASTFRNSPSVHRLVNWQRLLTALSERGIDCGHATTSALAARIFRPGSSKESDVLLRSALAEWERSEAKSGFAFGQQLGSLVVSRDTGIADRLSQLFPTNRNDEMWRQLVLRSLLWPRAEERRSGSMQVSNRFVRETLRTERTFVLDALLAHENSDRIDVHNPDWRESITTALKTIGRATLVAVSDDQAIKDALIEMTVNPLDVNWIFAHPSVERLRRRKGGTEIVIVLDEAIQ